MANSMFSIDGVISGMNTSAMIDQLMALENRPLYALQSKQTAIQAKASALAAIKSSVSALQSAVYNLTLDSNTNAKVAATNTPATSPLILTATAGSTAANGSFSVTVNRLATSTRITSGSALGQGLNATAKLSEAGFIVPPTTGTFSIKGTSFATFTIDEDTVLSDGVDAAGSNTILAKVNNAGIGITASIVNDSDGRPNAIRLASDPGVQLRIGSGADTSNFLSAAKLLDAQIVGNTAASVTGNTVAGGALAESVLTINGVAVATRATSSGNTAADNAASIAEDINNSANIAVTAKANGDGTITLTQKTAGAAYAIDVSAAGAEAGFSTGVTANGSDRISSLSRLAGVRTSETLAESRLTTPISGLDASGNGELKINGVSITYSETDSINSIISRINSSSAGVVASFDSLTDKMRITASATGQKSIALEDVTGNFLGATGVLNQSQVLGENALYSIDSVNNGEQLSSASNVISGVVPGVTLTLQGVSQDPVKVTVSQDVGKTISAVKDFVSKYTSVIKQIADMTKYDPETKKGGILLGDSTVRLVEASLRSMVNGRAIGATGKYQSLADIGVTTGAIGTTVGSGYMLQLDESKLTAALQENPAAVNAVLSAFSNTAVLNSTAGGVESITGRPTVNHYGGSYKITTTTDPTNNVKIQFTRDDGLVDKEIVGTILAGASNSTLIPGVTIKMKAVLEAGEQQINVTLKSKGIAVSLNDYLKQITSSDGLFASRKESSDEEIKKLTDQMNDMQARIEAKREALQAKFARMEATLGRLQAQSNALSSQLAGLSNFKYQE